MQLSDISALIAQGGWPRSKTDSLQALAQASQKVHSPDLNDTIGVLAGPLISMDSGQAAMQSPQPVHVFLIDVLELQGGRISALCLPANNARLLSVCDPCLPNTISQ
jgi:hypothetical protein